MSLTVRADRTLIRASGGSVRHALVELTAPSAASHTAPAPVDVALVLARSVSVGGQEMLLARGAVAPALHTPLMSVTNAVSGIVLVGGLLQAAPGGSSLAVILGLCALLVATINVAGGFFVTDRMLGMFKKGGPR